MGVLVANSRALSLSAPLESERWYFPPPFFCTSVSTPRSAYRMFRSKLVSDRGAGLTDTSFIEMALRSELWLPEMDLPVVCIVPSELGDRMEPASVGGGCLPYLDGESRYS